jgi:hypothetical protein
MFFSFFSSKNSPMATHTFSRLGEEFSISFHGHDAWNPVLSGFHPYPDTELGNPVGPIWKHDSGMILTK